MLKSEDESTQPAPTGHKAMDHIVIAASLSALLAVAVTLAMVWQTRRRQAAEHNNVDAVAITMLQQLANERALEIAQRNSELSRLRASVGALGSMKVGELTGKSQPGAMGRVFVDAARSQWYFFVSGMRPAGTGKRYQLWLSAGDKKVLAGSFQIAEGGSATLLGSLPPFPAGNAIQVTITQGVSGAATPESQTPDLAGTVEDLSGVNASSSQPTAE